jgi:preprotein translocase subunit SecG
VAADDADAFEKNWDSILSKSESGPTETDLTLFLNFFFFFLFLLLTVLARKLHQYVWGFGEGYRK